MAAAQTTHTIRNVALSNLAQHMRSPEVGDSVIYAIVDSFSNAYGRVSHTMYQYPLSGQSLDCLGKIWDKPKAGYQLFSNELHRKRW